MKKIFFFLFFVFLISLSYVLSISGGESQIIYQEDCYVAFVNITASQTITTGEFFLSPNCIFDQQWIYNCTCEQNIILYTKINTINEYNATVNIWKEASELQEVNAVSNALTYSILLNGNSNKDIIMGDLKLHTSLPGSTATISWISSDNSRINSTGSVKRPLVGQSDTQVNLTATITKNTASATKTFTFTIKAQVPTSTPNPEGKVEVNETSTEVIIDENNIDDLKLIEVNETVSENEVVTLNLATSIQTTVDGTKKEITLGGNNLTLSRKGSTSTLEYKVEIPSGTNIQANSDWNGLITIPTVKVTPSATVTGTAQVTIEVGSNAVKLIFDKATKITIPGQAGRNAGYIFDGVFTEIPACTAPQLLDPDTLDPEKDCYITIGPDLIIWTKHFTEFVSYIPTPAPTTTTSTGGGGTATATGAGIEYTVSSTETNIKAQEGVTKVFSFDNINKHTITFNSITENSITITVASTPQTLTLNIGETSNLDLDNNGRKDISITLNNIGNKIADVTIKLYEETPIQKLFTPTTPEETQEGLETITGETVAGPSGFGAITGNVVSTGKSVLTSKPAKIFYTVLVTAAAIFLVVVIIVQSGGIYGIRRKVKKYRPKADYY
ncbi:MAG: hypothetical protein KKG75_01540 [Nanoarchaeota archaeon]|nr:hypothetical protein [Nanoarchaeota archaeon]